MEYFKNILEQIIQSNQKFINQKGENFFLKFQKQQTPIITLVCCSDSRIQSEALFHNSFNKVFTIRNIGNQIYSNEGSVDYGIIHLKTPILMILGHTDCGALKALRAGLKNEPNTIKSELNHLMSAIDTKENLNKCISQNLEYQTQIAIEKYHTLVENKELLIISAIYDLKNEFGQGFGKLVVTNLNGDNYLK